MAQGGDGKVASTDIVVIPIGTVASGVANELAAALSEVFLCRAEPGEGVHLPLGAWNPSRGQYLSSAILGTARHKPQRCRVSSGGDCLAVLIADGSVHELLYRGVVQAHNCVNTAPSLLADTTLL